MKPASSDAGRLLRDAARWRLLGLLMTRPRPDGRSEVLAMASELEDERLFSLARAAAASGEGTYLRLLGPGGRVSPREVAYRGTRDPGHLLSELQQLYAAFGYRPRSVEDPPDHVAIELGFAGMLCLKRSFSLSRGAAEEAGLAARALERLLTRHLGGFLHELARRLEQADAGYLAGVARLAADRCPADAPASRPAPLDGSEPCGSCSLGDAPLPG